MPHTTDAREFDIAELTGLRRRPPRASRPTAPTRSPAPRSGPGGARVWTSSASRCCCCSSAPGALYFVIGDAAGGAHPAHVRVRRHRHHVLAGAQDRERARRAARPVEPARARRPRRRAAAHRRARRGRGRHRPARRGRPRARRRRAARRAVVLGRRVAAHGRVGAGAQAARPPRDAAMDEPGRRRTPSTRLLRHAGREGPGHHARAARPARATELGKIGGALSEVETERTPLQREVDRLVRIVADDRHRAVRGARRRLRAHAGPARPGQLAAAACSPASRSRWPCCPRSSRSC